MLLGLFISTVGMFSCSSSFCLWAFLVLSTLCSIGYFKPLLPPTCLALLFLTSVLGGLLFLFGSLLSLSFCLISDLGLLLKLGFSPFHFWMVKLVGHLSNFSIFVLLGLLKVGPLMLLLGSSSFKLLLGRASLLIGISLIYSCSSVNLLLLGSGLLQFWVISTLNSSTLSFYIFSYQRSLFFCCCFRSVKLSFLLACLSLAGLPPFIFFVAKVVVLCLRPLLFSFILLLVSAVSLLPYAVFGFSRHHSWTTSSSTLFFLVFLSAGSLTLVLPLI